MPAFDLSAALRRIRRLADMSQRELADRTGIPKSTVAAAESGARGLDARLLAAAAALAGLDLALVDSDGCLVPGMDPQGVRDLGRRLFPAHLDPRLPTEGWWEGAYRRDRAQPWYTFDRDRQHRDLRRGKDGAAEDHRTPRVGDSPQERRAARRQVARMRQEAEFRRRLAADLVVPTPEFECTCPAACDELDDRTGPPVHVAQCACNCDVG